MRIIGIIPARYGSTRFPGKPLALINGKPLILHVYDLVKKSKVFSDVLVATDDMRIYNIVVASEGKAVITSDSHPTGSDRVAEVVKRFDELSLEAEIIVNIQGDNLILNPILFNQLIQPFLEDKEVNVVTLKKKIEDLQEIYNPNIVKVVTNKFGFAIYFSRAPIPYPKGGINELSSLESERGKIPFFKHIGIYAYQKKTILKFAELKRGMLEEIEDLEQLRFLEHGVAIKVVETEYDSISVDTPSDLARIQPMLKKQEK